METLSFKDFLYDAYPTKNSRAAGSYITAIKILDELFSQHDVFHLQNQSLTEIRDPLLIERIIDYIADEEDKYRKGLDSIFKFGRPTQTSYPRGRFCTAAIRQLREYIKYVYGQEATDMMLDYTRSGAKLSKALMNRFRIDDEGTEKEVRAKRRVGQDVFRSMLLEIYDRKCCLTGLEIPEVLRASHIIPWTERVKTRLNPENGLCLSATYDAAFDKHLISFDEDYRLVLSPRIKEEYSSDAFKTHFRDLEGTRIILPEIFQPSQEFLANHRAKLVV